jgi:adenosylhomocysteine nucleosidase
MEEEVAILAGLIKNRAAEKIGPFEYSVGILEGKEAVLLRCGIGKSNAAMGAALLLARFKPSLVINTGCAGGLNPAGCAPPLSFGDVVVSSGLVYHDFDITPFGYEIGQIPGMKDAIFRTDGAVLRAALDAIGELKAEGTLPAALNYADGLVGSGDAFMCDPSRIAAMLRLFPSMRAVEMEGAAIAHACTLFSTPFVVVRAMSDIAGEESPMKFDEYLPVAAQHSSEIVKRLVRNFRPSV